MKTDIQIAQEAELWPVKQVAETIGLTEEDIELYGKYKAKISNEYLEKIKNKPDGKLILVTAINPTPAGEGKTTISIGLGEAFGVLGKKAMLAVFGTVLWNQGRCGRRRICTGGADGGSESSFHGRFSCDHFRQQSVGCTAG